MELKSVKPQQQTNESAGFTGYNSIMKTQILFSRAVIKSTARTKVMPTAVLTKVVPRKRKSVRENVDWHYR